MSDTVVHQLYEDFMALSVALDAAVEPSLSVAANDCFRKALLLAAASHFEMVITTSIVEYVSSKAGPSSLAVEFVRRKALARQYHTLFTWDGRNANTFFALFGEEFKKHAEELVKADDALRDGIQAFLELGDDRNRLVHQGFGSYSLEKTAEEIFFAFERARVFADSLPSLLSSFSAAAG
jgi:hypothetical protein